LPPLKAAGHQADFQSGVAAATVALAAYYRALQTGEGEHVDFSSQAYIASFVDVSAPYYTYQGYVASRLGKRVLYPWGIFPCQDGLMFLVVGEEDQWQRLLTSFARGRRNVSVLRRFFPWPSSPGRNSCMPDISSST